MIQVGQPAPDFTLKSSEQEDITLSNYKGKKNVVILFFPLAFTGTCTKELCSTRDNIGDYENVDAEVLAISVDSMFTLAQFKADNQFNFKLLSDFNKDAATAYDTLYDDFFGMVGVAKRSAFVVDKEGAIKYAEVLEKASDLPDFEAIQKTLSTLN